MPSVVVYKSLDDRERFTEFIERVDLRYPADPQVFEMPVFTTTKKAALREGGLRI